MIYIHVTRKNSVRTPLRHSIQLNTPDYPRPRRPRMRSRALYLLISILLYIKTYKREFYTSYK